MPAAATTDRVSKEVENQLSALFSYVTPKAQARSAGIAYVVRHPTLYVGTGGDS